MSENLPLRQEGSPAGGENWRDLEYSGCFYCDKPWDHELNTADGTIYLCLDCYERRYAAEGNGEQEPK